MDEVLDPNDKALDELEKDITCTVCCGHYQEAKLLPCNHYCCRACVESLAERSRRRPFPCPECRKDATLPSGGVEQLHCTIEARKTLRDSLTPLRRVQVNIAGADMKLAGTEAQVGRQEEEFCKSIRQSFWQLKAILEQRETELVKKVLTLAKEKKDVLMAQRKGLRMAQTEIQSLVKFVEQNVENTSDQALIDICAQLQSKVKEGEKCREHLSLDPATTADLAYLSPSLKINPSDLGEVFQQTIPAILGEIESTCQLGETLQVTIAAPNTQSADIHAQLQSLADPASSVQLDVVEKGVGVYHVTYTTRIRGRHDLTLKVKDQDIAGSPFRVFVKIHPTQLGPLVRTITGVNRPWGIAINSKQQLVVAECGGKITVRERGGKTLQTVKNEKMIYPYGVATGPEGDIYVTDVGAHCLFKFDKDGQLLKTLQNEFQFPYFIKSIDNRLYVSDCDKNVVKILDLDFNVIGTISTKECCEPYDIAEGNDGLYVVSRKEGKIGVYTCAPNGEFSRHLNMEPSSVPLSYPQGICFDCSGHLFVTQRGYSVGCVFVMKPSGEHVATLSLASSGVRRWFPAGIAIDEDGFVYVCDGGWSEQVLVVF